MDISAKESSRKSRRAKLEVTGSPGDPPSLSYGILPGVRLVHAHSSRVQRRETHGSEPSIVYTLIARDNTTILPGSVRYCMRCAPYNQRPRLREPTVSFFFFFLQVGRLLLQQQQQLRRRPVVAGR